MDSPTLDAEKRAFVTYFHAVVFLAPNLHRAGQHLEGVDQPWHKNVNIGHRVDVWLLNLIPREEPTS